MLILYSVLYVKAKLAEVDKPSELTNSVKRLETEPPINKVGPFSTSQHKCSSLFSFSVTEVGVKTPVRGFINRQDRYVDEPSPPQRR